MVGPKGTLATGEVWHHVHWTRLLFLHLNFCYADMTNDFQGGGMQSSPGSLITRLSWAAWGVCLAHGIAAAQAVTSEPTAIVEDVSASHGDVQDLDYLEAGRTLRLSADETIVLGYLASCVRETIQGGKVTIGARQSTVAGGSVMREKVECDGGYTELSSAEASQSGVITFRQGPTGGHGSRSNPVRVYSVAPIFHVSDQASELLIRRLDQWEQDRRLAVAEGWLDLYETTERLAPGGLYSAQAGTQTVVFKVAREAAADGPVVGRLVRF